MTANDTRPQWVEPLLTMLEQEKAIYDKLMELSRRQRAIVEQGDAEPLLALLDQRQTLIDQLVALNAQLEPYRRDWPDLWSQLNETQQEEVRQAMDQVQRMLDHILEADEKDRTTLTARRQRVGQQINKVQQGTNVNRAYATGRIDTTPRFTDRTG